MIDKQIRHQLTSLLLTTTLTDYCTGVHCVHCTGVQDRLSRSHPRRPRHPGLELLVLHRDLRQLFAYSLVDLQVLGHTPVDADGLALLEVSLAVLGGDALLVAGGGQT